MKAEPAGIPRKGGFAAGSRSLGEIRGWRGSGHPLDRGSKAFLRGRFPPRGRKIHESRAGAFQSTRRGEAGLPLVPLSHAVPAVKAFAREDPRSRAPRRTAAALTAALRRAAF